MQHVINILPVILDQLFCYKLISMFVFVLQLLQPQIHAANNIRPFLG